MNTHARDDESHWRRHDGHGGEVTTSVEPQVRY